MDKYKQSEERLLNVIDNLKLTKQEREILYKDVNNLKEYGTGDLHNSE